MAQETVRVRVLGPLEVEGVDRRAFGSRRARRLVTALATARGEPRSVDRLTDVLWPDGDTPGNPGDQIAVLASRVRAVLGRDRLPRTDAGYALVVDWLDLVALDELEREARRRLDAGHFAAARTAVLAALDLVRGPLFGDEEDAAWVDDERAVLARRLAELHHTAAEAALGAGDAPLAVEQAQRALDADQYDEAALRLLMAARVAAGRRASALGTYARFREQLRDDLGTDPSPETEAVHTAILRDDPLPGIVLGPTASGTEPAPPVGSPLPGRASALVALQDARQRVRHGSRELVVIEGEPGIGKTTVLDAFTREIAATDLVLWARCDHLSRGLPLQPIVDALGRHVRSLDREEVERVVGGDAAVLAPLLELDDQSHESPPVPVTGLVDPLTGRARLFGALLDALRRLAAGSPMILTLDDVHLAGATTLDWLSYAIRPQQPSMPLLLAVTRRSEDRRPLPGSTTLVLEPLDVDAVAEIVGSGRARELHERSGGNPLFLSELAAADANETLPASIVESVAARTEQAGAPVALTLRTAAVLGPDIDLDLLAAVTGVPPIALLENLEHGVRAGFLREQGATFVFRHALVREALAASASPSRRALTHREAALAMLRRQTREPLAVAHHAREGGDRVVAATALLQAAELSSRRFDHRGALELCDEAVALADSAPARLARARAEILTGRYAEAESDARAAIGLGAAASAYEVGGWAAYFRRDMDACRAFTDDGLVVAAEPQLRASCLTLSGRIDHARGALAEAELRLEEAAATARGPTAIVASTWLGTLRSHQGRVEEALRLMAPATRSEAGVGHTFADLHAHMFSGHAHALAGEADAALAALARFGELVDRQGAERFRGRPENFRAWVLRNLGATAEADDLNDAARGLGEQVGFPETVTAAHLDLADGALLRGDASRARQHLDAALGALDAPQVFGWRQELRAQVLGARLALVEDAFERCERDSRIALARAEELGIPRYACLARLVAARGRARAGRRVDLDATAGDLVVLARVAGLEAWWVTAETARDVQVDAWWRLAEEQLGQLAGRAGSRRDATFDAARAWLDRARLRRVG